MPCTPAENGSFESPIARPPPSVKGRTPSPGTPGEGGGEGDFDRQVLGTRDSRHVVLRITLTLTLSRSTGRGKKRHIRGYRSLHRRSAVRPNCDAFRRRALFFQHPRVLAAPALAAVYDEAPLAERNPRQAAGHDDDALAVENVRPQVDTPPLELVPFAEAG